MNFKEYQAAAARFHAYQPPREALLLGAVGLCGEAGEVAEPIKKHCFLNKPLNRGAVMEELGDVLWYAALVCDTLGFSLEDAARYNIAKLTDRHGTTPFEYPPFEGRFV